MHIQYLKEENAQIAKKNLGLTKDLELKNIETERQRNVIKNFENMVANLKDRLEARDKTENKLRDEVRKTKHDLWNVQCDAAELGISKDDTIARLETKIRDLEDMVKDRTRDQETIKDLQLQIETFKKQEHVPITQNGIIKVESKILPHNF